MTMYNPTQSAQEKEWLVKYYEENRNRKLSQANRLELSKYLTESQAFDNFLAKKFGTVKRYGAEGAESMMGFFFEALTGCAASKIQEIVIGMAHRGRLNFLVNMLQISKLTFFHKVW